MLFESALNYVIDIFKDECESSDRRTKESNLFCFIGPRYICLPSNWVYGKSLICQVAPQKQV
jgi:hypothetical protein